MKTWSMFSAKTVMSVGASIRTYVAAGLLLAAMLVPASRACADQAAALPPEVQAYRTPLIITGEVTESAATAEKISIQLAGRDAPEEYSVFRHKVKIVKVIKDATSQPPPSALEGGKKAKALAAGDLIDIYDPIRETKLRHLVSAGPQMLKGTAYVLLLEKPTNSTAYFVHSCQPMDQAKFIEQDANVDKWDWGKAVDGLQLAVILPTSSTEKRAIRAVIALRNISDKPIVVNLYPTDKYISGSITGGQDAPIDFYQLMHVEVGPFAESFTVKIQPKAIAFIGPTGQTPNYVLLPAEPKVGKIAVQMTYTSSRDSSGDLKPWKGTIESAKEGLDITPAQVITPVAPKIPPINEATGGNR